MNLPPCNLIGQQDLPLRNVICLESFLPPRHKIICPLLLVALPFSFTLREGWYGGRGRMRSFYEAGIHRHTHTQTHTHTHTQWYCMRAMLGKGKTKKIRKKAVCTPPPPSLAFPYFKIFPLRGNVWGGGALKKK